jgi:hypothetical protein
MSIIFDVFAFLSTILYLMPKGNLPKRTAKFFAVVFRHSLLVFLLSVWHAGTVSLRKLTGEGGRGQIRRHQKSMGLFQCVDFTI